MTSAKDLIVKPITAKQAVALVKRVHYSGKVVQNSQLHFGVFLNGVLEGAMQFGPSTDKRKLIGLVAGTEWNNFIELNRMAFSDRLPRNSESRALSIAFKLIKKHYPHIEWVVSFSDAAQCGDGTIYRASGFVLTGINENTSIVEFPSGERFARLTLEANFNCPSVVALCGRLGVPVAARTITEWKKFGAVSVPGYQIRYIYFINKAAKDRMTVPIIPFSEIDRRGAGMYRGEKLTIQSRRAKQAMGGDQPPQRRGSTDQHAPIKKTTGSAKGGA